MVAHARERVCQFDPFDLFEQNADHVLHQAGNVILVHEREFHVELGKLRLPVGAQVLVTKTAHDLVVALHSRHHQQLLEQLRRLRQGEERAALGAAGHQVIPRAFRGGPGQHRRFDIEKALVIQVGADGAGDLAAQFDIVLHGLAAQVHVAVTQADIVMHVLIVQLERGGPGLVQQFQRVAQHFHLAGGQVGVDRTLRAPAHPAGNAHHVFIPQGLSHGKGFGPVGVIDHLRQPFPVAQVDKDHAAVVAAPVHPAAQGDFCAEHVGAQLSAIMAAHTLNLPVATTTVKV